LSRSFSYSAPQEFSTNTSRHFLKGIKFDEDTDWLALPSPPKVNKRSRRQSASFLQTKNSIPLQDVTNSDSLSPLPVSGKRKSGAKKNISDSKKRRSLCHVPSPVEHEAMHVVKREPASKEQAATQPSLKQYSQQEPQDESPVKISLDFGGDYSDEDETKKSSNTTPKKRNRRRQSILLPSESGLDELISSSAGTNGTVVEETNTITVDGGSKPTDKLDLAGLCKMQQYVRKYCAMSEDDPGRKKCAEWVRSTTGYSLILPDPIIDLDENESDSSSDASALRRMQRRDLLARIGPAVQYLEQKKKEQTRLVEQSTGCTVEKTRGGKYRYRNANGVKVTSNEYKNRYLEVIEEAKARKAMEYQALRQELEALIDANINKVDAVEVGRHFSQEKLPKDIDNSEKNIESSPSNHADKRMECDDMELTFCEQEDSIMNTTHMESPIANHMGDHPVLDLKTPSSSLQNDQTEAATGMVEFVAEMNEPTGMVAVQREEEASAKEIEESMLAIPDRDEESSDPEIARAERKLWHAIDTALEEYSREVIKIQARRKRIRTDD